MSKLEELQAQVDQLTKLLAQMGIRLPAGKAESQSDYIEHGSARHAALIGVIIVDDVAKAKADGYTVYTSPTTGRVYRLEDEVGTMHYYPGLDPDKVFQVVLRQKVNVLESGKPQVPANAPEMFQPFNFA